MNNMVLIALCVNMVAITFCGVSAAVNFINGDYAVGWFMSVLTVVNIICLVANLRRLWM